MADGSGDVASRWVNRIPVVPVRGFECHVVPVPPSQPMPYGSGRSDEPVAGTSEAEAPALAGTQEDLGPRSLRRRES